MTGENTVVLKDDGTYDPSQKRPMLALTFDDGPGQYTEELLDCLEENNAHATFFMLGQLVGQYPDEVKRMVELGCEIGNHSWDHLDMLNLSIAVTAATVSSKDKPLRTQSATFSTICVQPGPALRLSNTCTRRSGCSSMYSFAASIAAL